jgi:hypothetical protein
MVNKKRKRVERIDYEALYQDSFHEVIKHDTFILLQILAELKKLNGEKLPTY